MSFWEKKYFVKEKFFTKKIGVGGRCADLVVGLLRGLWL